MWNRELNKIINGKTYNTDTAELIDEKMANSCFHNMYQLFRKRTREYFIVSFDQTDRHGFQDFLVPQADDRFMEMLSVFKNLPESILQSFPE